MVATIDLNRLGGSDEPPLPIYSQRVLFGGCLFGLGWLFRGYSEVRGYRSVRGLSQQLFFNFSEGGYPWFVHHPSPGIVPQSSQKS